MGKKSKSSTSARLDSAREGSIIADVFTVEATLCRFTLRASRGETTECRFYLSDIMVAQLFSRGNVFAMLKYLINLTFTMAAVVSLSLSLIGSAEVKVGKPNIVLFFIDDLGWADIGVNGSTFYETPHIDKLAKGGVNFTHSYSANPVCSPTRAALMTGKAPQRVGITQWVRQPSEIHLKSEEVTIAEVLQKHGYVTGYIGKWHIGEKDDQMPSAQGFSWM
ncbi:MAG: hypothetical protein ACI9E1_002340, partial [Cryomorphaceae bacterium]